MEFSKTFNWNHSIDFAQYLPSPSIDSLNPPFEAMAESGYQVSPSPSPSRSLCCPHSSQITQIEQNQNFLLQILFWLWDCARQGKAGTPFLILISHSQTNLAFMKKMKSKGYFLFHSFSVSVSLTLSLSVSPAGSTSSSSLIFRILISRMKLLIRPMLSLTLTNSSSGERIG
jgi:hypothetical protein